MAITLTDNSFSPPPFAFADGLKCQISSYRALSGATTGTITAAGFNRLLMVMLDNQIKQTAATTFSGNVATLAFVVPTETVAARTLQSALTFTAVADLGQDGNSITIAFTDGADHGEEVVSVSGNDISIQIESGVSTATEVKAAYDLSAAANALATVAIESGHETDAIATASALALQGGVTGGARGTALLFGI